MWRSEYDSCRSLDDSQIINSTMVKSIGKAIQAYKFTYQVPNSSIANIIEEAIGSATQSEDCSDISAVLFSPAPYDNEPVRRNAQDAELLEMFLKSRSSMFSELQATSTESEGSSKPCTAVTEVRKCTDKIKTVTGDARLLEALSVMGRRLQELESENDE